MAGACLAGCSGRGHARPAVVARGILGRLQWQGAYSACCSGKGHARPAAVAGGMNKILHTQRHVKALKLLELREIT